MSLIQYIGCVLMSLDMCYYVNITIAVLLKLPVLVFCLTVLVVYLFIYFKKVFEVCVRVC